MVRPILIIDPGHGGRDPGGGSNELWKEKDFVLKISKYQFERYNELGVPVVMTRHSDEYLSVSKRTSLVRSSGAKYCHSNHINASGGDGAEVIHSIHNDGKMAKRIGKALEDAGQNLRRVFTRKYPGSPHLDYYFMNRKTGSVETNIIEYGFADSPKDDIEQLKDDWKKYAEAVVEAFCEHIGHEYAPPKKKNKQKEPVKETPIGDDEYKIAKGDNLTKIAEKFDTTVEALVEVNGIKDKNLIHTGDVLKIVKSKSSKPEKKFTKGLDETSIVDFLNKNGVDSSYDNRKSLAKEYGIKYYRGTANQNIELLDILKDK